MLPVSLGRSSALHAALETGTPLFTQLLPSHCGREVTVPVEGVCVCVCGWVGGREEGINHH